MDSETFHEEPGHTHEAKQAQSGDFAHRPVPGRGFVSSNREQSNEDPQNDRNSGKVLCERKLASGIIGNPITYKVKSKQYVSILAGIGGWIGVPVTAGLDLNDKFGAIGATAMTKAANLDKIPQAGTLFTFRVMD